MIDPKDILDIFMMQRYSVPGESVHHPLEGGLTPAGLGGAEKKHREKKRRQS